MAETKNVTRVDTSIKEPPLYKVIYLNDDCTTMEFVVETLIQFFDYTPETAAVVTQDIHENNSAVVAVLPHEIAEQKSIEITLAARSQRFPLMIKIEPDSE